MTSSIEAVRAALAKYDAVLKSPTSTANDCVAAMKRFEKSILPMDVEYVLATLDAAIRERDELRGDAERAVALAERLKLEAQCHASDARSANATIYEIYQVVTGSTGEPGNWHGAKPVRDKFNAMREALEAAEKFISSSISMEQNSMDEAPEYSSESDYYAGQLVAMIRAARSTGGEGSVG